jgi:hypothetical protein
MDPLLDALVLAIFPLVKVGIKVGLGAGRRAHEQQAPQRQSCHDYACPWLPHKNHPPDESENSLGLIFPAYIPT